MRYDHTELVIRPEKKLFWFRVIMTHMQSPTHRVIHTGSSVDLAFAVVVLASYFATFSSIRQASTLQIALMATFGIAYVAIGIYGYKFCALSDKLWIQLVYFAIQIPIGGLIIYLGGGSGFNALILLPLAGHSVVLLPQRWMYAVNTILVMVYLAAVSLYSRGWEQAWAGLPVLLAGVIFIMVFTQMAVSEEKGRMEVERLVNDLADANRRLREYALQIEELAIARERNRMAREIHDGLGHYLTTVHMQIQASIAILGRDPERAQSALEKAQNLTQEALVDVRRSVAALHSLPEETLPLPASIKNMLESCRAAGMEPEFHTLGALRQLSPPAQLTIFRTAQEGINNACKHSGASRLTLTLDYSRPDQVTLTVTDNGRGAERLDGGFGLIGLRERVHLLNGDIQINSARGQGFTIEVTVPG